MSTKKIIVTKCRNCPYYGVDNDGMYCKHPFWDDSEPYENMIITQNTTQNNIVPEKCPLRVQDVLIVLNELV